MKIHFGPLFPRKPQNNNFTKTILPILRLYAVAISQKNLEKFKCINKTLKSHFGPLFPKKPQYKFFQKNILSQIYAVMLQEFHLKNQKSVMYRLFLELKNFILGPF